MATYFASDVHLRLDRPERGIRLARLVHRLETHDHLVIVGDLCDFWSASRQMPHPPTNCPGLVALRAFRASGGHLTILAGNHDRWLELYYRETLDAKFVLDSLDLVEGGLRIHAVHGHLLGARAFWKGLMESKPFLNGFGVLPSVVAHQLESKLDQVNDQKRLRSDVRHLAAYRHFADTMVDRADMIVLGHIHLVHDDPSRTPRLVVLGGWHDQSSYLRIEDGVAIHIIEQDDR